MSQKNERLRKKYLANLFGQHEQAKSAARGRTAQSGKGRGNVECPKCGAFRTKKLRQKDGQFRRQCGTCHFEWWNER